MTVIFDKIARHICSIFINRPNKRNALDLLTVKKLQEAIKRFEEDDTCMVAILAGSGGNFCSGYDLNELIDISTARPRVDHLKHLLWPLGTRVSEKKIVIAAIDGHAAGFGYELALKCDFRIAERDARMGFLNRRLGVPIMNGGTVMLPHLIGPARSRELIATGKAQLAPEALNFGLVTYIADIGCAVGRAVNLARCIVKFHQPALMNDLRSLEHTNPHDILKKLQFERESSLDYLRNCNSLEMVSKFLTGELFRHGNTDMGNLLKPEPEVTL